MEQIWNTAVAAGAAVIGQRALRVGEPAPVFSLPDADMDLFDLGEMLRERRVLLHFYPRDAMPSSRKLAIAFSEQEQAFARQGVLVVGVSLDECLTHADFRDEHGIAMALLSDPDGEVCRLFGVWQERVTEGVTRPTVQRATFLVDRDGLLLHADYNVDLQTHTEDLLTLLKSLGR